MGSYHGIIPWDHTKDMESYHGIIPRTWYHTIPYTEIDLQHSYIKKNNMELTREERGETYDM